MSASRSHIASTHRELRRFLARCVTEPDVSTLREDLRALVKLLPDHFAEEEAGGGFLDSIQQLGVTGSYAVKNLRREHTELLAVGQALVHEWRHLSDADKRARLDHFADTLGDHEMVESAFASDLRAELG